ncbi:MAG: TraR/DksA C4-type zinc finger protein [Actinomycetota bacterium]|nr:TraR/DksA C4-type zinc finger protein [Actinomycetota bacterium]
MTQSGTHSELTQSLERKRAQLKAKLADLTAPPEQNIGVGFGKRVGDGTTEAVERISTTATARSIDGSIKAIDAALLRIAAGTYGVCEICGSVIPDERLEARPSSLRCVHCARQP